MAAVPIGDPNTQAYFGPDGVLTDDVDATMTTADWIQNTSPGGPQAIHINRALRSVAIGAGSVASGLNSFAQGDNSTASGVDAHAEGNSTQAIGAASHAEGVQTTASDVGSHAEGNATAAQGPGAHAEGQGTVAFGVASHAEGNATIASGVAAHAAGIQAQAPRVGQWSHSSGQGALPTQVPGNSQIDLITMVGFTPGAGANESVELRFGDVPIALALEDGKSYTFTVTAVVGAVQGVNRVSRSFIIYFNAKRDGGVTAPLVSGVGQSFGDSPDTNDWTFAATAEAAPDRVALTFTTGAIASAARVTAEVRFMEIAY